MQIIAEGPCKVSRDTFIHYTLQTVDLHSLGLDDGKPTVFIVDYRIGTYEDGV